MTKQLGIPVPIRLDSLNNDDVDDDVLLQGCMLVPGSAVGRVYFLPSILPPSLPLSLSPSLPPSFPLSFLQIDERSGASSTHRVMLACRTPHLVTRCGTPYN